LVQFTVIGVPCDRTQRHCHDGVNGAARAEFVYANGLKVDLRSIVVIDRPGSLAGGAQNGIGGG